MSIDYFCILLCLSWCAYFMSTFTFPLNFLASVGFSILLTILHHVHFFNALFYSMFLIIQAALDSISLPIAVCFPMYSCNSSILKVSHGSITVFLAKLRFQCNKKELQMLVSTKDRLYTMLQFDSSLPRPDHCQRIESGSCPISYFCLQMIYTIFNFCKPLC